MRRFGQAGRLKAGMENEYLRLHSAVWPGVLETIGRCNIRNYTIFMLGNTVFAYFEYIGGDYEADMQKMAENPVTQQWWTLTHPCFEIFSISEHDEFYADMREIFHFDA